MFKHIFRVSRLNTDAETNDRMHIPETEEPQRRYFGILAHFAKNRTQVYMYLAPTIISILIASHGTPDLAVAIPIVSAIYFAALATYMYNDVTDISVDKLNSSKRLLASGKARRRDVLALVTVLNLTALSLTYFTGVYTTMVIVALIVLGIVYSHPKTSLKEKFPHKTIATAAAGGLSSLIGGLAVGNMIPYVIYVALVSFSLLFIMGPIADTSDLKGDKAARRRTFPLVLGVNKTLTMMMLLTLAIMLSTIFSLEILHINTIGVLMIIGICSFIIITLRSLMKKWNSPEYVWRTRNKMKLMHILLQASMLIGIF